jgi:hypothetical protein
MSSDSSAPLVSSATPIRSDAMVGANLVTLKEKHLELTSQSKIKIDE